MTSWLRYAPQFAASRIRKFFEPAIDPARVGRVYHEFEEMRGYRDYQAFCRTQLTRSIPASDTCSLVESGFQTVEVMTALSAIEVLNSYTTPQAESFIKRDSRKLKGFRILDLEKIEALFTRVLSTEVDALVSLYFQSEYLVHWFTLSRTAPDEPPSVSFKWHCDKGPRQHLKLLLYLNDATEHGGGTAFVDIDGTAQLARSGYLFARGRKRTSSIEQLSRLAGQDLRPYRCSARAGTGVLFQPSKVLHCGIVPTLGPRYVLTLCFLPSPMPWLAALRRKSLSDLASDPLWHAHARELQQRLSAPAR